MTHQAIFYVWREDHKRGYARMECECGWRGETKRIGRMVYQERFLDEWREHLPLDHKPQFAVVMHDGMVETGQAHVCIEGEDSILLALWTQFTGSHLRVHGFWHEVGDLDDAQDYIFPAARVRYVESNPWWDRDDIWERDMPKPPEAEAEEARWREEPE